MTPDEIKALGHLAKIHISDEELSKYTDINNILDFIAQLNTVDTNEITPMAHPFNMAQPLRDDIVTEENQFSAIQNIAKERMIAGVYTVPQVIDKKEQQ